MIKLKALLKEITGSTLQVVLDKIKNKQFRLYGQGDNGRVYEIDGEDKVFKITKEQDEYSVAEVIVGRWTEFTTFIPVYYVDGKHMYIMAKASELPLLVSRQFNQFIAKFKDFTTSEGGEATIFNYLDNDGARDVDIKIVNFLRALQRDIHRTGINDLDLDLDFKTDNIMVWDGKLVMIDW